MQLATIIFLVKYTVLGTALLMTYFAATDFRHYRAWRYVRNGVCSASFFWCITALVFFGA